LSTPSTTAGYQSTGGYTCSVCGTWVALGAYHSCGTPTYQRQPQTFNWIYPDPTLVRIAAALERIAAALEQTNS
jgi:hypothetical protein